MNKQENPKERKKQKPRSSQKLTQAKKDKFPEVLRQTLGNISEACKLLDINRNTYYLWAKTDPKFAASVEHIGEFLLDFAEAALFNQMKEGNPASIIFYLKTKGKKRGYNESPNAIVNVGAKIEEVNIIVKERED